MLERASICIEPASHAFLRRIEAPVRSHRLLGASFWENGGSRPDVPPWWPVYLAQIRQIPQAQNKKEQLIVRPTRQSEPFIAHSSDYNHSHAMNAVATRSFSQVAEHGNLQQQHQVEREDAFYAEQHLGNRSATEPQWKEYSTSLNNKAQGNDDIEEFDQDDTNNDAEESTHDTSWSSGLANNTRRRQAKAGAEKQLSDFVLDTDVTASGLDARYKEAWNMFVRLPQQETLASMILGFLVPSDDSVDLDRALRAYSIVPHEERVKQDYDNGVTAAMKRRRMAAADQMCTEALNRDMSQDCRQTLLLSSIRRGLWQHVAQTWRKHFLDPPRAHGGRFVMTMTSSSLWSIIDAAVDLPLKLLVLFQHLLQNDSTVAGCVKPLLSLASNMLYRVFASPRIMGSITGKGVMQLQQMSQQLGIFKLSHYTTALRTLHSMQGTRNRPDLTLMIYRSLRHEFPDANVHQSVFGGLIESCVQAEYSEETLTFLLDEFAEVHGKADQRAYQRVMTGLAWQGDALGVERILKRFVQTHGAPQTLDYVTPSLYVHARIGDVENTQARFDELQEKFRLPPNVYCYNILMYSYLRSQQPDKAFTVFEDARRNGIKPDAYSFGTIMSLASEIGDTEKIHDLLDQAYEEGIPTSSAMLDTLVISYCLNDEFDQALRIAEHASQNRIQGSPVRMWNVLLRHCAFRSDSATMLKVQNRMRELHVKPDNMTYAALMTALIMLGRTKDAAAMLRTLHTSEALTVTPFHYALVLHGYAKDGNRDMVNVIYHELEQRFPQIIPSARLAKLRVQADRAITRQVGRVKSSVTYKLPSSTHAVDYLGEILLATMEVEKASKQPSLGFGQRFGDSAVYVEYMIRHLASNKQTKQAQSLLDRYDSLGKSKFLRVGSDEQQSIQLLVTRLIVATEREQWKIVDDLWDQILQRAIKEARPARNSDQTITTTDTPQSSSMKPHKLGIIGDLPDGTSPFTNSQSQYRPSPLDHITAGILPARRFILSLPLNKYMLALDLQKRHGEIISLVRKLENAGFALSSKNWNVYVQRLCKSTNKQNQLLAFELYETKFLANTPDWKSLRKGQVSDRALPPHAEQGMLPVSRSRKLWERIKQDTIFPTYYTAVFLATRLAQFLQQATHGDPTNFDILRKRYTGTLKMLQQIPILRDRVQGTLLRSRALRGDPMKRPTNSSDRSGILGSRSSVDHLSHDQLVELEQLVSDAGLQDDVISSEESDDTLSLQLAEKITGEVFRSSIYLENRGRFEHADETAQRIDRETTQKLGILETIRRDLNQQHLISNRHLGDGSIGSSIKLTPRIEPVKAGALLNATDRRLEKLAEELNKSDTSTLVSHGNQEDQRTNTSPIAPPTEAKKRRGKRSNYDTSILARRIVPSNYRSKKSLQAYSRTRMIRAERRILASGGAGGGGESDEPVNWHGFRPNTDTNGTQVKQE